MIATVVSIRATDTDRELSRHCPLLKRIGYQATPLGRRAILTRVGIDPLRRAQPLPLLAISIPLASDSREDTGHTMFHMAGPGDVSCASCHIEAGDDGHVWNLGDDGPLRTQSLRGGILATAPYHWNGEFSDIASLVNEVFARRMGLGPPNADQINALAHWLNNLPTFEPPAGDADAIQRGAALFADASIGCTGCHSGPMLTNNQTVDVGTGGSFQVPSLLGLASRAPYMHNGCANSLVDRFSPSCGGGEMHGHTAALTSSQESDLVAYLASL
jgi:cytochrome c peroxidase